MPGQRVLIQPNDVIILQNTLGEAIAQYFTSHFFEFNLLGTVIRRRDAFGTTTTLFP